MSHCSNLFKRLLYQLDYETGPHFSDYYLHLLRETQACDHQFDLEVFRKDPSNRESLKMALESAVTWRTLLWYKTGHQIIFNIPLVPYRPQPS